MKRYGIIGAGMMGREHISNLALFDDIELVAMADPDAGSLKFSTEHAAKYGMIPACYVDTQEMLEASQLDAVIIASPNFTHFDVMQTVMPFQVAILLEKPMCTRVEDARDLHKAALAHDHLIWVGLEYRYMPPVTAFTKEIHAGVTGPVKMLSIREHRFRSCLRLGIGTVLVRTRVGRWLRNAVTFLI